MKEKFATFIQWLKAHKVVVSFIAAAFVVCAAVAVIILIPSGNAAPDTLKASSSSTTVTPSEDFEITVPSSAYVTEGTSAPAPQTNPSDVTIEPTSAVTDPTEGKEPTKPKTTKPKATDPKPTDPKPTEPPVTDPTVPPTTSPTNPTNPTEPAPTEPAPTKPKKSWKDTSGLTWTQADVGKVVGFSAELNKDIVVTKVSESAKADGRKVVKVSLSDDTSVTRVECKYCHKFPCPNGGGSKCPEYNVGSDPTKTCQQCHRPIGDGHNGTCYVTIDWATGRLICHHYD